MPAGTAPTFLPAGNLTLDGGCNSIPTNIPTDKKGKWQNVLLGQTITLAFNIRFDSLLADGAPTGLGNLKLCPSMTTMGSLPGPDGKPGTGDELFNFNSTPKGITIPNNVFCVLSQIGDHTETVHNLLELANLALANQLPAGVSFSDVNNAVSAINEGFDECRFLVSCVGSCNSIDAPQIQQGNGAPTTVQPTVDRTSDRQEMRGFALWSLDYNSCNGDPACIQKRQAERPPPDSSDSSEQSDWIQRIYQAAYGTTQAAGSDQLVFDSRVLNRGVNTSRDGWEYLFESNKQTFTDQFVRREGFSSAYPIRTTPAELVDRLFQNAGVAPSQQDRDAAIKEFRGARDTSNLAARGHVLRMVAEH